MKNYLFFFVLLLSGFSLADSPVKSSETTVNLLNETQNEPIGFQAKNACSFLQPLDSALCESLFQKAPEEIHDYVALIEGWQCDRFYLTDRDRYAGTLPTKLLLVGKPGVGKTTLAQVVAQKLARPAIIIRAPMIGNEYKNSEANNLMKIFESIINLHQHCVVIIDEINIIAEPRKEVIGTDSSAAATLWLLLDLCVNYPNILIIGTTNNAANLPDQLKDRFEGGVIEISVNDLQTRYEILNFYFSKRIYLGADDCIWALAKKTKNFSPRQLEALVTAAQQNQMIRDARGFITEDDIDKAYKKFVLSAKILNSNSSFISKAFKEYVNWLPTVSGTLNLAVLLVSFGYMCVRGLPAVHA